MLKRLIWKVLNKFFSLKPVAQIFSRQSKVFLDSNYQSFSCVNSKGEPFDLKLNKYFFKNKEDGFYIELGAFDGLTTSNTAFFEKYKNWTGLLIEPSPKKFNECVINRPNSICLNEICSDISNDFVSLDHSDGLMSKIIENKKKLFSKTTTLEEILDKQKLNRKIDFLSVDVEGYELKVLKGLNLDKYRPKYILVEIWYTNKRELFSLLSQKRYKLLCNLSNYNIFQNPKWGDVGRHNDFLFEDLLS